MPFDETSGADELTVQDAKSAPRRKLPLYRKVLFSAALFLSLLVVLEIIQWTILPAPDPLRRRPGPVVFQLQTDGRLLPGISGETRFTTESHGLRYPQEIAIPKPAGVYRVFCVGGSTTECTYLDDNDAWPARAEALLRERPGLEHIEVINAGFSGLTALENRQQIEQQLFEFEPDAIVLMAGMNDHIRRLSVAAGETRSWHRSLVEHSMTARRLVVLFRRWRDTQDSDGTYALDPKGEVYQTLRAECAATPVAKDSAAFEALPDPIPEFRAQLIAIADTCRNRRVSLILATHPNIYSPDLPPETLGLLWMRAMIQVDGTQAPMAWHVSEIKKINDCVRSIAAERNLPLIDADALLEKSSRCYYDDCHLNVNGSRSLAESVAEKLSVIISPSQ